MSHSSSNDLHFEENELGKEQSLFLRHHKHQPINWLPWCESAFVEAKYRNILVFITIGYTASHSCHVMAREVFEDISVAEFLNKNFVAILVDREERPDLDAYFMAVLQQMGFGGGWPITVFCTPDGYPVSGGPYISQSQQPNLPSFLDVLKDLDRKWQKKPEELKQIGIEIKNNIEELSFPKSVPPLEAIETLDKLFVKTHKKLFDYENGGFSFQEKQKFPLFCNLSHLLRIYFESRDPLLLEMVEKTLKGIRSGGVFDQVGGGIYRFSRDEKWETPCFEKLLVDNALYLQVLTEVFQLTGKHEYYETILLALRFLMDSFYVEGRGFFSSEDSDYEGKEGEYYVWTRAALESVLGKEAPMVCEYFGVDLEGDPNKKHLLRIVKTPVIIAGKYRILERDFGHRLEACIEKLLDHRKSKPDLIKDDKILVHWNALMIQALAMVARIHENGEIVKVAEKVADFIWENFRREDNRLLRRFCDGEIGIEGILNDYANYALSLIYLYESTFNLTYLKRARHLLDSILKLFKKDDVFTLSPIDFAEPIINRVELGDSAEPSGISVVAHVLLKLSVYYDHKEWKVMAHELFKALAKDLNLAFGVPLLLSAYENCSKGYRLIVVCGASDEILTQEFFGVLRKEFRPGVAYAHVSPGCKEPQPFVTDMAIFDNYTTPKALLVESGKIKEVFETPSDLRFALSF